MGALGAAVETHLAAGRVLIELEVDPADGAGMSWLHRHTEVIHKGLDDRTGRIAMTVRADAARAEAVRTRFANGEWRMANKN
jgi:GTP-binding protein HflX